jgi:hypothetical protein
MMEIYNFLFINFSVSAHGDEDGCHKLLQNICDSVHSVIQEDLTVEGFTFYSFLLIYIEILHMRTL